MQVQIKFKRTGSNSVYGSFSAGDVMRCNKDVADHFVSQGLAKYVEAAQEPTAEPVDAPVEQPKRKYNKSSSK